MAGEQTSRLTMTAEALGFDASAKAVDTLALAQARLAENQKALDEAKSGGSVEDVAKLTSEQQKLSFVVDELNAKNEQRNTTDKDWVRVLSTIDPVLGDYARRMASAVKGAGDLATQNFTVKGAVEAATGAIKDNVSSLALLGAGGALLFGINAIVNAIGRMGEEARQAEAAIRKQVDALNGLAKARGERSQSIEDVADARRGGGFSAEQSTQAQKIAEQIGREFEALKPENINRAVGSLGDRGLSKEQLTQAAVLLQTGRLKFDEGTSPERMQAAFERALARNQEPLGKFFARENAQLIDDLRKAIDEANQSGGSTAGIERFIRTQVPPDAIAGKDVGQLARIVAELPGATADHIPNSALPGLFADLIADAVRGNSVVANAELNGQVASLQANGVSNANAQDVRAAQGILVQLVRIADRLEKGGGTVIHNNEKNYRLNNGAVRNGNNGARDVETR